MPNFEPKANYLYGSRQKRLENFDALVNFLEKWKKTTNNHDSSLKVATRFCNVNMQYGYVSRNDIIQQALMKVNLL